MALVTERAPASGTKWPSGWQAWQSSSRQHLNCRPFPATPSKVTGSWSFRRLDLNALYIYGIYHPGMRQAGQHGSMLNCYCPSYTHFAEGNLLPLGISDIFCKCTPHTLNHTAEFLGNWSDRFIFYKHLCPTFLKTQLIINIDYIIAKEISIPLKRTLQ